MSLSIATAINNIVVLILIIKKNYFLFLDRIVSKNMLDIEHPREIVEIVVNDRYLLDFVHHLWLNYPYSDVVELVRVGLDVMVHYYYLSQSVS